MGDPYGKRYISLIGVIGAVPVKKSWEQRAPLIMLIQMGLPGSSAVTDCAIHRKGLNLLKSHLVGFKGTTNRKVGSDEWPDAPR
jgi:hypothetical protein